MELKRLFQGLDVVFKGGRPSITGISSDSRTIAPGNLFIAKDSKHIAEAAQNGAAAILTDLYDPFLQTPQLIIKNPAQLEPLLANRYYGYPSKEMFVVGITGSKGKTTTTYLVRHLLKRPSGLISTIETLIGEETKKSTLTTHFPLYNQKALRDMLNKGVTSVAIEVSSHGLDQERVEGIEWDAAIFTNLYPDHLDYHKTVEQYAAAKKKLFTQLDQSPKPKKRALMNQDSPWLSFMKEGLKTPLWTFGLDASADIYASDISCEQGHIKCLVHFQGRSCPFQLPVIGQFNIYNVLGAIGVRLHLGADLPDIAESIARFTAVPGRLQQVADPNGRLIYVDYAHTGEALASALATLQSIKKGKIICVFGCGGGRDPNRRKTMAKAAEEGADLSILTTDNPRHEDPLSIIAEIAGHFSSSPLIEPDRKTAIHQAIALAKAKDIVLIAGKGHEKNQIFAHQTIPFVDAETAIEALATVNSFEQKRCIPLVIEESVLPASGSQCL